MNPARILGAAQVLAINAVSIYGVFGAGWPVGTAIALYWLENVLRGLVILLLLFVWQVVFLKSKRSEVTISGAFKLRDFAALSLGFNAAHAIFLAVILGMVVPRMMPAQRFESGSFRQGVAIISVLIVLELFVWLAGADRTSDVQVQLTANAYVRRVVVLHLTIVCGMFGVVVFNRPAVLFGAFAALKTLSDVASQLGGRKMPRDDDRGSGPAVSR